MADNPETKVALVKAGIKLFALNSYSDVSVDNIVAEAGISKGSFYYYFKSKDEFYKYLLNYAFTNLMEVFEEESKGKKEKEELLYAFIKAVFISFEGDRNIFFLIQKELIKIVIGEESDFRDYQIKIFELLKNILVDEEDIICFYVMGIIRSSIIYHLKTSESLDRVLSLAWSSIKKLLMNSKGRGKL